MTIEQAEVRLMAFYHIDADSVFNLLTWRSRETNIKSGSSPNSSRTTRRPELRTSCSRRVHSTGCY
jgi:hypothetical protein